MDLNDYLKMLRRGWAFIILITLLSGLLAALYAADTPRRYQSTTSLYITAAEPNTVDDLERASNFSSRAATTYATVIDSATVLAPVASSLNPPTTPEKLGGAVTTTRPENTTLVEISVDGDAPQRVADIANSVARVSTEIIPRLETNPLGRPLVRVEQTRPALVPAFPLGPDVGRIVEIGLILGLCLGITVTLIFQRLDSRIQNATDLPQLDGGMALASIPRNRRGDPKTAMVARDTPTSPAGEAYRVLRTNLGFVATWKRRSLLFTSIRDDNRGTEVATNTAWTLAQAGKSVVLVDANMRANSTFGGGMPSDSSQQGLSEILQGVAEIEETLREPLRSSLRYIPAGSTPHSPSDVLSLEGLETIVRALEVQYDYVIVSGPPLRVYPDAAILAAVCGGTLILVPAGRSRAQHLEEALSVLAAVRVKPVGVVLTDVKTRKSTAPVPAGVHDVPVAAGDTATSSDSALESPTLRNTPLVAPPASPSPSPSPRPRLSASIVDRR